MKTNPNEDWIKLVQACVTECRNCANALIDHPDVQQLVRCVKLCSDCNLVCSLIISLAQSKSELLPRASAFAAEVCQICADECSRHTHAACSRCAAIAHSTAEALKVRSQR